MLQGVMQNYTFFQRFSSIINSFTYFEVQGTFALAKSAKELFNNIMVSFTKTLALFTKNVYNLDKCLAIHDFFFISNLEFWSELVLLIF